MLDIEDFKKKINEKSRLMGIDPGKRRIGISICDENQKIATPHKNLIKKDINTLCSELEKIIKDFNIKGLVIGNPINLDGSPSASSQLAKDCYKYISTFNYLSQCGMRGLLRGF